jgi:tRNA (guanine37-N1)-methyltransferase
MKFDIITIFPRIFDSYFGESIIKRAQETGAAAIKAHDLRDWTTDRHRTVDDTPYGGGAGMVMKIEPLYKAMTEVRSKIEQGEKAKTILFSAKGRPWTQQMAAEYAKLDRIIMICGRYEGVDDRITEFIDEEISIGDYVLTGGEIPAMVAVDSIVRLLPGVLGNAESAEYESHSIPGLLEYPQYTRPEVFTDSEGREHKVPSVLLSGNHAEIEKWRKQQQRRRES